MGTDRQPSRLIGAESMSANSGKHTRRWQTYFRYFRSPIITSTAPHGAAFADTLPVGRGQVPLPPQVAHRLRAAMTAISRRSVRG
jgi:hypothetical protein